MANSFVTPTKVMREVADELLNNIRFGSNVNRSYDSQYSDSYGKVGDTVKARLPQRFRPVKGAAFQSQPTNDQTVDITLTDQAQVGMEFSTRSLTLEIDDYKRRYIMPAVHALANVVDTDGFDRMYLKVAKCVGAPGTTPGSTGTLPYAANNTYSSARVKLEEIGVPVSEAVAMLSPDMHMYLASANTTVFNPSAAVGKFFKTGMFSGEALGIGSWFSTQNIPIHTTGALGGTPLVNDTVAEGATSVITDAWTSAAATRLLAGDVIQFAGCYELNPVSFKSTGRLKDFVVTADAASDSSGNLTVSVSPAMRSTGNQANCSALPANNAAITIFGHASTYANKVSPQGLVYHPDAFALVFADLEKPEGLWVSERLSNKELGISIRFLKDYSIDTDQSPARLDILYGWAAIRQELACRVAAGPGA